MMLVTASAWSVFIGCSAALKKTGDINAILITVDTLRADHLACYGYRGVSTPSVDRLAADGVLFRQDISQVPLTLPSHCSLLTGLPPAATRVHDQAGFTLPPDIPTLSTILKGAGLATAAFVGSSVLNADTGLARGFDVYSDLSSSSGASAAGEEQERPGDQVMGEALRWIETPGRGRFFIWIHLFDPHAPYAPPEPYRTQYAAVPYDGEIAFVDSVVGRLVAALQSRGSYDKTLIVFTADHGEGLGEHAEQTHGFFLYDSTLRVPLIMKFPGSQFKGRVIAEQVRGIDVAPTILHALSVGIPSGMQGVELEGLAAGRARASAPPALSETYFPYYHFGWSPLTSIRTGQYKFVRAPRPELYDLGSDPQERQNIAEANRVAAGQLAAQLGNPGSPPKPGNVSSDKLAKLKTLGYLGSRTAQASASLADPKDKIETYNLLESALRDSEQGRLQESNTKLRRALTQDARLLDAHLNLGVNLAQLGDVPGAVDSFRKALSLDPRNVIAIYNLALGNAQMGRAKEAIDGFQRALEIDPRQARARLDLGRVYLMEGNTDAAIQAFQRVIQENPNFGEAHYQLSRAYNQKGWEQPAQGELLAAQRLGFQPPPR
jgi:arylsulfatase A-like enzyme/Tfp pilus assembly protein PilF